MRIRHRFLVATSFIAVAISASAFAQTAAPATKDPIIPGHPRINQIDERLENQQKRMDAGVNKGQINAKQEERDQARDAKVEQQLSADEAKHHGHITKAEERQMNRELNRNSRAIYRQRHHEANKAGTAPAGAPVAPATPAPAAQ